MIIPYDSLMEILEHSFDGIRITDGKGRILYANTANAALLGVSKRDLEGKTTQELLDEHIFSDSVILRTLKTGQRATHTSHNYCTGLDVLATATPILDRDGNIQYIVNNVRDVTALSRMRDSLRDYDEVIRIQKKQIDEMRSRYGLDKLIAHSQSFRKVIELAHRVAPYDGATVLILGESGTGKELIAETIVENSPRKGKPFIRINCGAIPENLLESELFGYEKGAFTGADSKGKKGLFEAANTGTIFLDEIGEMPLHLQVKLLRVLQQKEITRVGGSHPIPLDVHVLAATNRDLRQMVHEGTFREDLYYRLNVVSIQIPPLRERQEDIIPLIHHFLRIFNQKYGMQKSVQAEIFPLFERYPWPGNVRELENQVENLMIVSQGDIITREDLPDKFFTTAEEQSFDFEHIIPLRDAVEQVEKSLIEKALAKYGSTRKAAAALGINASTIVRKMQSFRQTPPD